MPTDKLAPVLRIIKQSMLNNKYESFHTQTTKISINKAWKQDSNI